MIEEIYLDMDGVLVDFVGGVIREFGVFTDMRERVFEWDQIPSVITAATGTLVTDAEMWGRLEDRGEAFWRNLEWLPWGQELYKMCCDAGPVVLMTTPSEDPYSAAGKLAWIQEQLPAEQHRRYSLSPCKPSLRHSAALLIDDGEHNVDGFRAPRFVHSGGSNMHALAGGRAVLVPAPWNSFGRWPTNEEVLSPVRAALAKVFG